MMCLWFCHGIAVTDSITEFIPGKDAYLAILAEHTAFPSARKPR
jgi:hypothetical protein